jgi:hypothetical protein
MESATENGDNSKPVMIQFLQCTDNVKTKSILREKTNSGTQYCMKTFTGIHQYSA